MTIPTRLVLRALLSDPLRELYGVEIGRGQGRAAMDHRSPIEAPEKLPYRSVERVGGLGVAEVTNTRDDDQLRRWDARLKLGGDPQRGSLIELPVQQQGGDLDSG